jgi:hypothetical protein
MGSRELGGPRGASSWKCASRGAHAMTVDDLLRRVVAGARSPARALLAAMILAIGGWRVTTAQRRAASEQSSDLSERIAQLKAAGINVAPDPTGRFVVDGIPNIFFLYAKTETAAWEEAWRLSGKGAISRD